LPKLPRLTAREAEARLLAAGFSLARSKGSHRLVIPTTVLRKAMQKIAGDRGEFSLFALLSRTHSPG
jgi:predicted RNA binding protein YcfA (HicA-like mRNA interferase family)